MNARVWPAPAKLNLFLHVTGRREDGYHELQTLFQLLDYGDELEISATNAVDIQLVGNMDGIDIEDNLVTRAARLLKQQSGTAQGASIVLKKQIPPGGGLGGGSSDAATTLVALNEIWQTGFSIDELAGLGLKLGADVPVFVHGRSAWAEGTGEILTPVDLPGRWYVVIYPGCHVNTGMIFNSPDLTRNTAPITISDFDAGNAQNDCEPVVFKTSPQVAEAHNWLGQWGTARMTGTGSCVFGQFESESKAREVLQRIPGEWQGFVSQGLNRSPLHELLTDLDN